MVRRWWRASAVGVAWGPLEDELAVSAGPGFRRCGEPTTAAALPSPVGNETLPHLSGCGSGWVGQR